MTQDTPGFATRAIHAGQEADALTGAVVPPIHQVSTYKQDGIGGLRGGYEYSRSANPTRTALETCLASLEGGARGFAFASGLAGQDCVIRSLLVPGDHLVVPSDAYGGTYRYVKRVAGPHGIDHTIAPMGDLDAVRAAIRPGRTPSRSPATTVAAIATTKASVPAGVAASIGKRWPGVPHRTKRTAAGGNARKPKLRPQTAASATPGPLTMPR